MDGSIRSVQNRAAEPQAGAPRRRRAKRLTTAALVVYAFAVALGLGLGSAYFALRGDYPLGGVTVGAWTSWPRAGAADADPYARAIVTRRSEIPLAIGEGLALTAQSDSAGRPLDSVCTYVVGSITPQARLWTLTVYDEAGGLATSDLQRASFTSAEILRAPDGQFTLRLSRDLQPGNWIKLPATSRFTLVLRLYDTPATLGTGAIDPKALPTIERTECGA